MDEDRDDEEEDDDPPENVGEQTPHLLKTLDMLKCIVRGQRPSSMGGLFFFCLYQEHKYVLTSWYCHSEILSHGLLFFSSVLSHYI
jgi:hypothetical protein